MARSRAKHGRAYKRDYAELFDEPTKLFGQDVNVILWHNGQPGIRIVDGAGRAFDISAGHGPAGFGITVRSFRTFDVFSDVGVEHTSTRTFSEASGTMTMLDGVHELELCQYDADVRSQQFRGWYRGENEYPAPGEDSIG